MQIKKPKIRFSCCACGACCACTEVDLQAGDKVPPEFLSEDGRHMRAVPGPDGRNGRCAALVGEVGKPGIRCAVYDARPLICRQVKRGEPMCLACRWHYGLPGGRLEEEVAQDIAARHGGKVP